MLGTALVGAAASETKAAAVRLVRISAVYVAAGMLFVIASAYAVSAAYIYLWQFYGPINGSLILAAVFGLLGLAVLSLLLFLDKKHKQETKTRVSTEAGSLATVALLSAAPLLFKNRYLFRPLIRNRQLLGGIAVPLLVAGGMFLWARSSPGLTRQFGKYLPDLKTRTL